MKFGRSVLGAVIVTLVVALPVAVASAERAMPQAAAPAQDGARTPAAICEEAAADAAEPETREFEEAEDVLQDGVDYAAILCTAQGPIYIDLFEELAPATVNNFVFLAQQDYYNGTTFHRVLAGFMAQGGDPTGTGAGGPGYTFEDETDNGLTFDTYGLLAMANAGADTNGSQFFITYVPTDWLNGGHTIFGQVVEGMNTAELLTPRDPDQSPGYEGDALATVVIIEDPAAVSVTPDSAPDVEHFQTLLDSAVTGMGAILAPVEGASGPLDLEATTALWAGSSGEAAEAVRASLEAAGLQGTASVGFRMDECLDDPEALPIWYLSYQVADFGAADAAQSFAVDDARADQLVDLGVFESSSALSMGEGRMFTRAGEEICGPSGKFYRVEIPQGRYLAVVELVLDDSVIGEATEPTGVQFAELVANDLVTAFQGVIQRGNSTTAAE